MGRFFRWLSNNHVLVVIFIALSASFLKWLGKTLKEQRERRQQAIDRERREIERIRTGRDPSATSFPGGASMQPNASSFPGGASMQPNAAAPPVVHDTPTSARESLEQIAARRRARMDQLRRQSAGGSITLPPTAPRPANPAEVLGQILSIPGSAGPTVPGTRPPAPRPAPAPKPARRQTSQPPPIDPAQRRRQLQAQIVQQTQRAAALRPDDNSEVHRLVPDYAIEAPTRRVGGAIRIFGQPATPADWRRAILLQEVLGAPRSLADDSESIPA